MQLSNMKVLNHHTSTSTHYPYIKYNDYEKFIEK